MSRSDLTDKQRRAFTALWDNRPHPLSATILRERYGISHAVMMALIGKGYVHKLPASWGMTHYAITNAAYLIDRIAGPLRQVSPDNTDADGA